MSGINILRRLLLKEAVKGSGQASGIMSIGDNVRKLAEKRLQSYLLSAQKQGVDLDKLGEQEIRYMLEMNKPKAPRVISQDDPEFVSFRDQILGKKNRDNVIQGKFGKPFKEEIGSVDNVVNDITRMEPIAAMKEVNKVLRREGKYKNLSKQDSEKVFNDTDDWINQRDPADLYDYKNKRPFREDPNFDPDDPDFDPENFADGGVAGLLGERTGFRVGGASGREYDKAGGSKKSKSKSATPSGGGGRNPMAQFTSGKKPSKKAKQALQKQRQGAQQTIAQQAQAAAAGQGPFASTKTKKGVLNYLDSIAKYAGPFVDPRKKPGQVLQLYKLFRDPLLGGMGNKIGYDQKNFNLGEDSSNIAYDEKLGYIDLNTGQPINMTMPGATQVGLNLPQTEYLDKLAKMPKAVGESGFLEYKSPKTVREGIQQLNPKSESFFGNFDPDKITYGDPKTFATDQDVISYMKEKHGLTPTGSAAGTGIIGLELADGGPARQNFAMGRRAFLKLLGVGGAGIAGLKTGIGLGGKKAATEVAKDVATEAAGTYPPPYFFKLVEKIKFMGDDVTSRYATKERQNVKRYKDYELTEDLETGDIVIKKRNEGSFYDQDAIISDEYIIYKPGQADELTKGKKPPSEYDEYTVRPDAEGKLKEAEDGLDSIDEILEEVGDPDSLTLKKADGGIARMLGE